MAKVRRFFRRQFKRRVTSSQIVFDIAFGLILPLACFVFDPLVFKGGQQMNGPMLEFARPFAYLLAAVSMTSFVIWIICSEKLRWLNIPLSGILFTGSIVSFFVGFFILPFSLLGLVLVVGALGFTPFVTSFVYLRNGMRAFNLARETEVSRIFMSGVLLASLAAFIFPAIFNLKLNEMVYKITHGDPATIETSTATLKYFSIFVGMDPVVNEYIREEHPSIKKALKNSYNEVTGGDIYLRWGEISDCQCYGQKEKE